MRQLAALGVVLVLLSAGCAAIGTPDGDAPGQEETAESPTVSETPEAREYDSLEELRQMIADAGAECDSLQLYGEGDAEYGVCLPNGGWSVHVFPSMLERNEVLELNASSLEPGTFLVGPNWLVGVDHVSEPPTGYDEVQATLRGIPWKAGDPIPMEGTPAS